MPRDPVVYTPSPYVRPENVPDTRSLRDLLALASQAKQQHLLQRGQQQGQGRIALGALIANALGSFQQSREQKALRDQQTAFAQQKLAQEAQEKQAELDFRREQLNQPMSVGGRLLSRQGDVLFEPPAEPVKPEPGFNLSPGQSRFDASGKPVASLPPEVKAEPRDPNPTEASLALLAANGNEGARRALGIIRAQRPPVTPTSEPLESVMGADGNPVLMPRSQAAGKRPAMTREQVTEDERKTAGFYRQMNEAMKTMDEVEGQLTKKDLYQIQSLPQEELVGLINRGEMTEAAKRYLRAFEQFTEARLRPVSGAAISDTEFARDRRTYAKQYGETEALNKDRRTARTSALESLKTRSARALPKDSGSTSGGVIMVAPNGQEQTVSPDQVEHYKSLGAKVKG